MQIQSASLVMGSQRSYISAQREHLSVEVFRSTPTSGREAAAANRAQAAQPAQPQRFGPASPAEPAARAKADDTVPPELRVFKQAIEMITGRLIELFDAAELSHDAPDRPAGPARPAPPPHIREGGLAGFGMRITASHEYREQESTQFAAAGVIRTADGQDIRFSVELSMQRQFVERSSAEIIIGEVPQMKDPLVINFNGTAAQLSDGRYEFDLDADGLLDDIPGLAPGHAFLVMDRNGNGQVDDGGELFGALSGDAYADLRQLDKDGNGYIDAGDSAFDQLGVWRPGDTGITAMSDTGIGAVATQAIGTEFLLTDAQNTALGQIRATSIYVTESGQVGTTQQVDLVA